jgi:hypothetical protein
MTSQDKKLGSWNSFRSQARAITPRLIGGSMLWAALNLAYIIIFDYVMIFTPGQIRNLEVLSEMRETR